MLTATLVLVIVVTSLLLFAFGLNMLFFGVAAFRVRPGQGGIVAAGEELRVLVQLPVFNERYVARRVIEAACALEWPRDRLTIQVLDDSTDRTVDIVAESVRHARAQGIDIRHVRRGSREGYKAGALAVGLAASDHPLVAMFDADFIPPVDFLRRTTWAFRDPQVAFVQTRWGHLNETFSGLTRVQALAIDFHFLVEQVVRPRRNYLTNFSGTAGIWRRAAIEDAGGWSARTLTEDLDLSYRALLRGWRPCFLEDVVTPEELPVAMDSYRGQQTRWATGSFQVARLMAVPVLRSALPLRVKAQALAHLGGYGIPVLMLAQLLCYPALLFTDVQHQPAYAVVRPLVWLSLASLAPAFGFAVAQVRRGRRWWSHLPGIAGASLLGFGMTLTATLSLWRALRGGGEFMRTAKFGLSRPGDEWQDREYVSRLSPVVALESVLGLAAGGLSLAGVMTRTWLVALYAALFSAGFLSVSLVSLSQAGQVRLRRALRARPAGWWRGPSSDLLALGTVMAALVVMLRLPLVYEDSYQHWLMAAHLAATGNLHDPLFGMEDTWLPGWQLVGAGLLRLTGLHHLDVLRWTALLCAFSTVLITHRLAGGGRRGRMAALLLGLNPVFLLTATSATSEPLLTLALAGAILAAARSRWTLALAVAGLACLTGIKAWLWLGAAATGVVLVLPLVEPSWRTARRTGLAWGLPLAAVVTALEAAFGFATHSTARAAQESAAAVIRGSISPDAGQRLSMFSGYFGLSSLALLPALPGSVLAALRRHVVTAVPAAASLLYLIAVLTLVAGGVYTGSHRYLYVALPPLAVAAALALDRWARPMRVAALLVVTATALLYQPVFSSLARTNQGLEAAGIAVRSLRGALVTDSPAVAYWSGRPVTDVHGSQELPSDPAAAIAWMRREGVVAIVVEDIDYYHATSVLPDLARGRASGPFQALGDESLYQSPGGKRVYAFRLTPEEAMR
ncbi:MAG: glycosyltransferase [Candidatus Dormibacteria bacterium]